MLLLLLLLSGDLAKEVKCRGGSSCHKELTLSYFASTTCCCRSLTSFIGRPRVAIQATLWGVVTAVATYNVAKSNIMPIELDTVKYSEHIPHKKIRSSAASSIINC